jgi:eukaryotic-like serine/threonine-protein kinase
MSDALGRTVGNYHLTRLLGSGGFADVYLGEHLHLPKEAAIKLIRPQIDKQFGLQFLAEAKIIASLRHDHIVEIFDYGDGDRPYIIMEFAPHGSLRERHPMGSILSAELVVGYVEQVASALQYAHDHQVKHLDVKPQNCLLRTTNDVVLSDFGVASQGPDTVATGKYQGTPVYSAPEHLMGKPRFASDQYALALMTYEWLTGRVPFTTAFQRLYEAPPAITGVDKRLQKVILHALAKEPKQRFASVTEFARALADAYHQSITVSHQKTTDPQESIVTVTSSMNRPAQKIQAPVADEVPTVLTRLVPRRVSRRTVAMVGGLSGIMLLSGLSFRFIPALLSQHQQTANAPTHVIQQKPKLPTVGTTVYTYTRHSEGVTTLSWSPDGKYVASGDKGSTLYIWEALSGKLIASKQGSSNGVSNDIVTSVAWSPDGKFIAISGGEFSDLPGATLSILEAMTAKLHVGLTTAYSGDWSRTDTATALAWSPNSSHIVAGCDYPDVSVWDVTTHSKQFAYAHPDCLNSDSLTSVAWSPDGKYIASAGMSGTIQIHHAADGSLANELTIMACTNSGPRTPYPCSVDWSSPNSLVSGQSDGTLNFWSLSSTSPISLSARSEPINTIACSPDGVRVAVGFRDGTADIWTREGLIYTYTGHSWSVNSIAWSPNGQYIASGSSDNTVQVWLGKV